MPLVLLVEDNPMNRKLMRDILEIRFDVLEATCAVEAVSVLRDHNPDLILMDLQLPDTDGVTLTQKLKSDPATAAIPIVAISAHAMQHNIDEALTAGCVAYFTKPLVDDPVVLVDRLALLIQDHRA